MTTFRFLSVFTFLIPILQSTASIPVIQSTTSVLNIEFGELHFDNAWHLEPDKELDVYSIGSEFIYYSKRVSFITDVDSITFDVEPGNTYDFIVMLNGEFPCPIQIKASPHPHFLYPGVLYPLLILYGLIFFILYWYKPLIPITTLLTMGYFVPVLFWGVTIVSGWMIGDYHHLKDTVSELGILGSNTELLTSSAFVMISILHLLFIAGFYRASKQLQLSVIPSLLSLSMPFSMLWAAIFPLGNGMHSTLGPLPLLMIIAIAYALLFWRHERVLYPMRLVIIFSLGIMLLFFLRFIPSIANSYEGLIQRFYYTGWTIWIISLSYFLVKLIKQSSKKNTESL